MTEAERLQMETYLQEDPMLADVVEGLEAVKDANSVPQTVRRLQSASRQRLQHRIPKREKLPKRKSRVQTRTFTQLTMSMAAGLAFLVVCVWVFRELTPATHQPIAAQESYSEAAPVVSPQKKRETESPEPAELAGETELLADAAVPVPAPLEQRERTLSASPPNPSVGSGASPANQPIASLEDRAEEVPSEELESPVAVEQEWEPTASPAAAAPKPVMPAEIIGEASGISQSVPETAASSPAKPEEEDVAAFVITDSVVVADDVGFELADVPLDKTPELSNSVPPRTQSGAYAKEKALAEKQAQRAKSEKRNISYGALPKLSQEARRKAEIMRAGVVADVLMEGIAAYEKGRYTAARFKLDEVLLSSPENVLGQYYMGSSYFYEGNFQAALPYLKAAAGHPEASVFEESQWELAQTYLLVGRKRPAKRLLQQIVTEKGTYAVPAQTKLSEL
jgi:tetratricopeptide (TPR) repeat protein